MERGKTEAAEETKTLAKILVGHEVAGGIIGKKGSTINALQQQYAVRLRLSMTGHHFPGTTERVLLVMGPIPNVLNCLADISSRIKEDLVPAGTMPDDVSETIFSIRLAVPVSSVGRLIGKGGDMIRQIQEKSRAKVAFYKESLETQKYEERVCEVSGTEERVSDALSMICQKLSDDPRLESHQSVNYPPPQAPGMVGVVPGVPQMIPFSTPPPVTAGNTASTLLTFLSNLAARPDVAGYTTKIEVHVPAAYAGALIGNKGHHVREIQTWTNTNINISPREAEHRTLEISGVVANVWYAHCILVEKILQEERKRARLAATMPYKPEPYRAETPKPPPPSDGQ